MASVSRRIEIKPGGRRRPARQKTQSKKLACFGQRLKGREQPGDSVLPNNQMPS